MVPRPRPAAIALLCIGIGIGGCGQDPGQDPGQDAKPRPDRVAAPSVPSAAAPTAAPPPSPPRTSAKRSPRPRPAASPTPAAVLLHERPRFADPDLQSRPDDQVTAPPLPGLPPPLPAGAPGQAEVRVTGAWTAALTVTSLGDRVLCMTQQRAPGSDAFHRYYAGNPSGFGVRTGEYGLGRGQIGLELGRRYHYSVDYEQDRVALDSESYSVSVHWRTDDEHADVFSSGEIKQRFRFSDDRRRVAFAVGGYVGPVNAFDRYDEVGPVEFTGTVSCPGPMEPVPLTAPR